MHYILNYSTKQIIINYKLISIVFDANFTLTL